MIGFDPGFYGIGSDRSANCSVTTAPIGRVSYLHSKGSYVGLKTEILSLILSH